MADAKPDRVIAYVDGFNLYHGIVAGGFGRYKWLNIHALAANLLDPGQQLVKTKYFTARLAGPRPADRKEYAKELEARRKRQNNFLEAIGTIPEVEIFYGHYQEKPMECRKCSHTWMGWEEKMSDVAIATELLVDTFSSSYDTALIISGDGDLVPPIKVVRKLFGHKKIYVSFPPERFATSLQQSCHKLVDSVHGGNLSVCQLPEEVTLPSKYVLRRPVEWTDAWIKKKEKETAAKLASKNAADFRMPKRSKYGGNS